MTEKEILTKLINFHFERYLDYHRFGEAYGDSIVWGYSSEAPLSSIDKELNDAMIEWSESNKVLFSDCETDL